jgi:hypothetical protein
MARCEFSGGRTARAHSRKFRCGGLEFTSFTNPEKADDAPFRESAGVRKAPTFNWWTVFFRGRGHPGKVNVGRSAPNTSEPGGHTARHTWPVLVPPLSGVTLPNRFSAGPDDAFNAQWRPGAGSEHEGSLKDLGGLGRSSLPGGHSWAVRSRTCWGPGCNGVGPCQSRCQRILGR